MSQQLPSFADRGLGRAAMRPDLTGNGANVHTQPMREMPIPGAETGKVEVVPPETKYVTTQQLAPILVGLIRASRLMIYGAAGGLLVGLKMGSRSWDDLLWGALIGALATFLGRGEEAVTMDQPKTASITEKV